MVLEDKHRSYTWCLVYEYDVGRRAGFEVEGVEVGASAFEKEE